MTHDPRCERSASDPKRCRCECGGRHHGEFASQLDLQQAVAQLKGQVDTAVRTAKTLNAAYGKAEGVPA